MRDFIIRVNFKVMSKKIFFFFLYNVFHERRRVQRILFHLAIYFIHSITYKIYAQCSLNRRCLLSFAADCTTFLSTYFIYVAELEIDPKNVTGSRNKHAVRQRPFIAKDKILTAFATLVPVRIQKYLITI